MKKIISFVLLTSILVSCSTVLLTGRKQLLLVPDSEVLSSSFQSYKQFIDSVPASTNKTQSALVKKVGAKIAAAVETYLKANGMATEVANYAWEFNLVKDTTQNAFCMPGGKVVVYEGILPITKNEAGLAVVLGHEIAHAVAKHSNERLSQQMIVQVLLMLYLQINLLSQRPVLVLCTDLVLNMEFYYPTRANMNWKPII